MIDYLLDISFDAEDPSLDELVAAQLFVTRSTGSSSNEISGTTTVTAYFDTPEDRDEAAALFGEIDGTELLVWQRERVDWLDLYEQSLEPILIGCRFVVAPDARLFPPDSGRIELVVPQEQGFGTGSHETTALCMEILETLALEQRQTLDVGTGSGILALAMARLGVKKVIAFDNDVDAYGAMRDNRLRNAVDAERLALFIGSVEALRAGSFDVITMNIIPEVILPLLPDVVARLSPGGTLILSGILLVRRDDVIPAAAALGLSLAAERSRGEWWAGSFQFT